MAFQHKDGTGALFRNDQKGNERAPRYRGELMINGTSYELAAWVKEGARGTFFSCLPKSKTCGTGTQVPREYPTCRSSRT